MITSRKKYKVSPEYPWQKYDGNAVFRHADNNKWFALVMDVQGDKVGVPETDIPYHGHHEEIHIKALMKIHLQKRYKPECFTFETLKAEYGIYAVQGPRGVPNSLSAAFALIDRIAENG